ncbi:MAG: hypothetical protein KDB82_16645 [Planctomycetes bacterium]|nr:hypothetical protein [Planctomycetota bacterium]
MRCVFLLIPCLLAGCVARNPTQSKPLPDRFDSRWNAAEDWQRARQRFSGLASQPDEEALPGLLFWPDFTDRAGLGGNAIARYAGRWELTSGSEREALLAEIRSWRADQILTRTYRVEASVSAESETADMPAPSLPDGAWVWKVPFGRELLDAQDHPVRFRLEADRNALRLLGAGMNGNYRIRVLFRLDAEPIPTESYRHGDEVTIARWGCALIPVAFQLAQDGRKPVSLFLEQSAK